MQFKSCLLAVGIFGSAVLFSAQSHAAPVLINDFGNLAADAPFFTGTWSDGTPTPVDQYIQNSGSISIAPVSGGNPTDEGSFTVSPGGWSSGFDLTSAGANTQISLTAKSDAGSVATDVAIIFSDASFNTATATFTGFGSVFSTQSLSMVDIDPGFDWTAVTDWAISGGLGVGDAFRFSFDKLEATAVPEPATWALLAGTLTTVVVFRRRSQR